MSENEEKSATQEKNEELGKLSGLAGGAVTGAAIGTSIMPVVGTVAGAIVGGVVGSEVGKTVGGKFFEAIDNLGKSSTKPAAKPDVTAELERLAKLRSDGVIDDEEFKAAKARILNI